MVVGLKGKNKRNGTIQIDYIIHIQEIKPWPPSQSLRSLRSVLMQWKNGECNSGSTNLVAPSLGSVIGEGKIGFNESFKLSLTLSKDMSMRGGDADVFQKNCLEFNLYEPRRDNNNKNVKGQLLGTASIDLADYGILKERLSISVALNCKRSFRNTDQPLLWITIQPVEKSRTGSSLKDRFTKEDLSEDNGGGSVSTLMSEEYAEEAEIASFTDDDDDDVSSHSSVTAAATCHESGTDGPIRNTVMNDKEHPIVSETRLENLNMMQQDTYENLKTRTLNIYSRHTLSQDSSSFIGENPDSVNCETSDCKDNFNGRCDVNKKSNLDWKNCTEDEQLVSQGAKKKVLIGSTAYYAERLKNIKSVKSPAESARNIGLLGSNEKIGGNIRNNEKRDAKIYPKETRNASLDGKMEHLENRIRMLEGELIEAAAIEAALYSVVAEHGSSMNKVHTPARRLSRLYLHACKENQGRRSGAAKSSVSGLVLVAKACGNDVQRLTFWLSNTIVLRTIISLSAKDLVPSNAAGSNRRKKTEGEGFGKIASSPRLKGFYSGKNENTTFGHGGFGNWDDPYVFTSALEKVEAWIFSRIVESIWWQTLTPHMQPIDAKLTSKEVGSTLRKNYRRVSSYCDQEQGNLSLDIWKNAFRESCERLCPIRAGGHECGCLPMLPRLIMEQCLARLDVAMFNAILRESADEIPTDPVSDAISDPEVLPIPPGKSSFGAGAQLKTVIGTWSRLLSDIFGMDDDDSFECKDDSNNDERQMTCSRSFNLLNALSDLLMLPKDMLLSASIRKEVCPMFSAPLIKKILEKFVPDEFCPDPVPTIVFEDLDSKNDIEDGTVHNIHFIAAPIVYSPPLTTSIASIVGVIGSKNHLRRTTSCVVNKSYSSDDELDELKFPLSSIFFSDSLSSAASAQRSLKSEETSNESPMRYELLRDVWINSQ